MRAYPLFLVSCGAGAFAGATAFTLNLVFQVTVVGLDPLRLILVGTLMEAVCFLTQVPTGVIADLYGRRLSVVLGNLLMGAGMLLWGLVPTFGALLAANVIWAIGATCVDGAQEAWAADEIGESRVGRAFVRGGQVAQAATVLGIGASVALSLDNLALPIVVGGAVTVLLGLFQAVAMPERHFTPAVRGSLRGQVVAGARAVRRGRVLLYLVAATFFLGMSSEGFDRFSQPHFLADLALPAVAAPAVWFGLLGVAAMLGSIVLGSIVLSSVVVRRVDAFRPLLIWLHGIGALATLGFALAAQFWWAVAAYLVASVVRSSTGPLFGAWLVAETESSTRATVLSLQAQVDAAGEIAGGPPVGIIGQRASLRAALAGTGLLVVPAILLLVAALRWRPAPADDVSSNTIIGRPPSWSGPLLPDP